MRSPKLSAAVLAGLLTVSLAACGSNDDTTGTQVAASTPSAASTAPVEASVVVRTPSPTAPLSS